MSAKIGSKRPGALWATVEEETGGRRIPMPVAVGISASLAVGIAYGVSKVDMQKVIKEAEKKIMKVVETPPPPPPPPPPPEVKKIVPPPQAKPAPPTNEPPPPPQIAAVENAGANAPAVGTVGATGPATAPMTPPPPPAPAAKPAVQQAGVVCNAEPPNGGRMLRDLKIDTINGEVTVRIQIDGNGNVTDAQVVSSKTEPARVADRFLARHVSRYKCQATGQPIVAEQTFAFKFD